MFHCSGTAYSSKILPKAFINLLFSPRQVLLAAVVGLGVWPAIRDPDMGEWKLGLAMCRFFLCFVGLLTVLVCLLGSNQRKLHALLAVSNLSALCTLHNHANTLLFVMP